MHRHQSVLTEKDAKARKACIDSDRGISYTVFYGLEKGDNYYGLVDIEFFYTGGDSIFLDFTGDTIDRFIVNGITIGNDVIEEYSPKTSGKYFITESWLIPDSFNKISLKFHNRYYRDGEGLHTYVDTDGKQYIYTETEPFLQHRVIPCFDQPDLKGTFKRYVSCPSDWVAVTTEMEVLTTTFGAIDDHVKEFTKKIKESFPSIAAENKFYEFLVSKPLPTYLNSLFAGAYFRFDLAEDKRLDGLPMAIYCRETLRQFVEAQLTDIFEYHKHSVSFYSDFFQFKYPFSKCDAIFCPEYRMGAMEYPGGITYSEQIYLYRTKTPSTGEKSNRGRVIFHEMAHMWFGDTVTMKWWDGLWLNESFADFCCFEAWTGVQDNLGFDVYDGKLAFLARKQWGYREDVMITTHPIQRPVVDTLAAENTFDGITYPKGAACIKQLMTVLGDQRFKAAMVEYFKRYAFKNTTLENLIECCYLQVKDETHPIFNLDSWNYMHLQCAGLNWVKAEWDPSIKGHGKLKIHQGAVLPEHPTLRYHKMGIAFISADGKVLEEKMIIVNNEPITEIEYNENLDAAAVILNYGDTAFVRVIYDSHTMQFLLKNTLKLEKILERGLALKYINDSLKSCHLKIADYFPFILDYIEHEKNPQLLQFAITELKEIFDLIPAGDYSRQVFKILMTRLSNPTEVFEGDMVAMLFGSLLSLARDDESIDVLKRVIDGTSDVHHLKNFKYSLSQNWNIIYLAQISHKYTAEEKKTMIDKLTSSDQTDSKKEWALRIQGLTTEGVERRQLIEKAMNPQDLSYKELEYLCSGLNSSLLPAEVREDYMEYFFDSFLYMFRNQNASFSKTIRTYLMPSSSKRNDFIIERLKRIIDQTYPSEDALKTRLLMTLDSAQQRKKIYDYNSADGSATQKL